MPERRPRRTKRRMSLLKAMRFFQEHAGYVVGERARGALALARAEQEADRRGWVVEWRPEESPDDCEFEDMPEDSEFWVAVLLDRQPVQNERYYGHKGPEVLASLGCIHNPDDHYRRVVEAELALEALGRE